MNSKWNYRNRREHNYDDIIHLPHPVSKKTSSDVSHEPCCTVLPFAALTGYGAVIQETARLTDSFIELDEDQKERLDEQLRLICENLEQHPEIQVTYFVPDIRKNGGSYVTICGRVKRIDEYAHQILFMDGTVVSIESVFSISWERLKEVEK